MNNLLCKDTTPPAPLTANQQPAPINKLLYHSTWIIVIVAFIAAILLLLYDVLPIVFPHAPISAAPLLFIGVAYLGFQGLIKPTPLDLCKALIVSTAFLLWGVDQLLPASSFATTLGDVVITLYVVDLGWMMLDRLKQKRGK